MNQKKGNFRKAAIAVISSVCVLTSFTPIDAKAATATRTGTTTEGYVVSSTASYIGNSVTGTGTVVSGPPCSIEVYVRGYSNRNGITSVSCSIRDKMMYGHSFSKSTSANQPIVRAVCDATFNAGTIVTATAQ
ncbi:MAG: hypothetical protein K2M78_12125 [Lachnospiraceae bacterium]|nr:hypothetical protein [Lachnospiraceae bacterium]